MAVLGFPRARAMGGFLGARSERTTREHGRPSQKIGPLTGKRVRVLPGRVVGYDGQLATLASPYLELGAYWARLDERVNGEEWETVLRPNDWELL